MGRYGALTAPVIMALLAGGLGSIAGGCGDDSDSATSAGGGGAGTGTGGSGGGGGGFGSVILYPGAAPLPGESECKVVITKFPEPQGGHVPVCTPVEYPNPPTSGDHWPIWAAFKKYTTPVPSQIYVHDHEHGAVVLSYRCAAGCPEVVTMLEEVFDEVPEDPLCNKIPGGPKARMVLAPNPDIPTTIVASSWAASYTATCIDKESLARFVSEAYGHGPEPICAQGIDLEDPNAGYLDCSSAAAADAAGGG